MQSIKTTYISSGCNRTPNSVDWGGNGIICYGACNSVAIYNPKEGGGGNVNQTLEGHKGRVNAVCWIRESSRNLIQELVSVSTDNTGIVWTLKDQEFSQTSTLIGHSNAVTCVDGIYSQNGHSNTFVATASVDSKILIWLRKSIEDSSCSFELLHDINLKYGICLSLILFILPGLETPVLISGNDDSKVHVYFDGCEALVLDGHEDWIRAIDVTTQRDGEIFLASGSQDTLIRLWRLREKGQEQVENQDFKLEERLLVAENKKWTVVLEAVLMGHEGWIYGVQWNPQLKEGRSWAEPGLLLSCSLDRTIILWGPEKESGVWLEQVRLGELGGNALGYYGAKFSPDGNSLLGYSFQGSFRMWHNVEGQWRSAVTVGGHFKSVEDISWESEGRYLLSVSLDQTTRLHAPWVSNPSDCNWSWHELCRPQIHGHDLYCIATLPEHGFVSGAEEKISRVFFAPGNVLENLRTLTKLSLDESNIRGKDSLPRGAAIPALGLSNKAIYEDNEVVPETEGHAIDDYSGYAFTAANLNEPGTEDYLVQNSLWPETMKLYGHGYEIFSLATTRTGDLVASACKASAQMHAKILLWDTENWAKLEELQGHQLTVTQMTFSPDDNCLLSVSRDRRWCLFKRKGETKSFELIAATDKSSGVHSRIIWTCSWTHDSLYFATGSREGKLVVWGRTSEHSGKSIGEYGTCGTHLQLDDSVTSIDFAPCLPSDDRAKYLIACGGEKGWIHLYSWTLMNKENQWDIVYKIGKNYCHHLTVKRLTFRPVLGKTGNYSEKFKEVLQLASCSQDCSVRVYDINLLTLKL